MEPAFNTQSTPSQPRRRWRRRLVIVALVLLLLGGAWVAGRAYMIYRIRTDLDDAIAELDRTDPGWRPETIDANQQGAPDEEDNALRALTQAPPVSLPWPKNDLPGYIEQVPSNHHLSVKQARAVEEELALVQPAVKQARVLADRDTLRFPHTTVDDIINGRLEVMHAVLGTSRVLEMDARASIQKGNLPEASRSCRALINLGRAVGDNPYIVMQFQRQGGVGHACRILQRVLGHGELREDVLLKLQRLLEAEARRDVATLVVRGEWAYAHRAYQAIESGDLELDWEPSFWERFFAIPLEDRIRREHARSLRWRPRQLMIAELPIHERAKAQRKLDEEWSGEQWGDELVARSAFGGWANAERRHHSQVRTTMAGIACERYRLKHGDWPVRLEELGAFIDAEFLVDPCDGAKLRYKLLEDGILIYSVGLDGIDNGGDLKVQLRQYDVGMRLWDAKARGLPPLPEAEPQEP